MRSLIHASILAAAIGVVLLAIANAQTTEPSDHGGADPPVDVLIRKSIEAYGGEEALLGAGRFIQRGSVTSSMREGRTGAVVRVYERPIRLRVEIEFIGAGSEVRILDGGRGWRDGNPAAGPMYQAMLLQAARLGLPALFIEFTGSLEDLGSVERDGKRLRAIGLAFHRGLLIRAEIDPESGRILRSEGSIPGTGSHPDLKFATEYSDFRQIDGVLVPFHEVNYAQGRRTGETRLDSAEFVDEIPAGAFHPRIGSERRPETERSRT